MKTINFTESHMTSKMMKSAVLHTANDLKVENIPVIPAKEGEVLMCDCKEFLNKVTILT